jgi:hypothetical protein
MRHVAIRAENVKKTKVQRAFERISRLRDRAARARDKLDDALGKLKENENLYRQLCYEYDIFPDADSGDWLA